MADVIPDSSNGASSRNDVDMADAARPIEASLPPTNSQRLPTTVTKPIPYTFDLGHLLALDASPLPSTPSEPLLAATARDAAQSLINQLLTTCELHSSPDGVTLALPPPSTALPREKSVPAAREPTAWERFAARKGIQSSKRRDARGKTVYDEEKGEWVPRWGYKGKNREGEGDWLVEVDEKKERETGEAGDGRREGRTERKERVRRNERRMRANERRAGKGG